MPLLADRVLETTTTAGTGTFSLAGAITGYRSFNAVFTNGDIVYYTADNGQGEWEVGYGTVGTGTLTRNVIESSNADALVVFSAGTKKLFCTAPAVGIYNASTGGTISGPAVISVSSASDALRITQTGAGNALVVEDSANPDSTPFVIDSAGRVGIGTSTLAGYGIRTAQNITGGVTSNGVGLTASVQSDVTTSARGFFTSIGTQATAFTAANLSHYIAQQATFGAGSTVTNQYGFVAESSLTGATNNYGFYSAIASGTGRYNFYAAGSADNYFFGNVGIGAPPAPGIALYIQKNVVGSGGYSDGIRSLPNSDPATTTYQLSSFTSVPGVTASSSFTRLVHYWTFQNAFGAGASVTNQYGFLADASLTGATNNYGFYSGIASGSGRYNFYAAGSAPNYFAGAVGINGIAQQGYFEVFGDGETAGIRASTASGNATFGVRANDYTSSFRGVLITQYCASATGTSMGLSNANLARILIQNSSNVAIYTNGQTKLSFGTFGIESLHIDGGQSVWSVAPGSGTNGYGFGVSSAKTGATNNYGFYSNIASGTGRWNFYAAGTAPNYFAGDTTLAGTTTLNSSLNGLIKTTAGVVSSTTATLSVKNRAGATVSVALTLS